jgi:hypothetical protein
MTTQGRQPILKTLRDTLRLLEAESGPETEALANLKRVLNEEISKYKTAERIKHEKSMQNSTN